MNTEENVVHRAFPGQRPNEHVVIILRRHWILWARYIFQLLVSNIIPVVIALILYYAADWHPVAEGPIFVGLVFLLSTYYLGAWLLYFHSFVDYRLDMWILTDQRIVNIEQQGLFDRIISELSIVKVQDVTSEVHGHAQTFLDFGNVYVQTAGEQQRFIFQHVPHPEEIARLVVKVNDAALKREQRETISMQQPEHASFVKSSELKEKDSSAKNEPTTSQ